MSGRGRFQPATNKCGGSEHMSNEIELIGDGDGLAVIGHSTDVERFLLDQGLSLVPSRELDMHRLWSRLNTAGAVLEVATVLAENSGRWIKLTAESAEWVHQRGLMQTKTPGVFHAMIGSGPGHSEKWLQVVQQGPGVLTAGPMAPLMLATMMQQQAIQQQMDEIVEYLQEINEKVDDILRGQKDAVLADMIGVDLIIEEAWTVSNQVGRVSEVTWSKIQGTSATIARTQAYAVRQLDAIAEKLSKQKDPGDLAKAAEDAEVKVREWLAVLARCFQLEDAIAVLELDRVLDACPDELEEHRLGLSTSRQNRYELIARSTARLLAEMDDTVNKANSKVLFNPFKSPAAVKASNQVALDVLDFRGRLGIESDGHLGETRRWGQAAAEVRDEVVTSAAEGLDAARRYSAEAVGQVVDACRPIDLDGDGIPDKPRALSAVEDAGAAMKGAALDAVGAIGAGASDAGVAIGGLAVGAKNAVGSFLHKKPAGLRSAEVESLAAEAETASTDA